ncbi:MAG: 50S ribosomal protein L3 [Myxococcota bacterium]
MPIELLCRKLGMTQVFDDRGQCLQVTVLEAGPNTVVQKKTVEKEGYTALQLGFGERRRKTLSKGVLGHFDKAGVSARRHLAECRVTPEEAAAIEVGQDLTVSVFEAGQRVDVQASSKGRGMTGVVKRHNFAVKRRTHGTHEYFRHGGAIGAGAYPGKVIKGMGMPGRYGGEQVTTRNLRVVQVDPENNLLLVRGAVPGHNDALVRVRPAIAGRS